jgi:hypothetical protein
VGNNDKAGRIDSPVDIRRFFRGVERGYNNTYSLTHDDNSTLLPDEYEYTYCDKKTGHGIIVPGLRVSITFPRRSKTGRSK